MLLPNELLETNYVPHSKPVTNAAAVPGPRSSLRKE